MFGIRLKNIYPFPHRNENKSFRLSDLCNIRLVYNLKRHIYKLCESYIIKEQNLFRSSQDDEYTGHTLKFKLKKSGIEKLDMQIRQKFTFPRICETYNINLQKYIQNSNSVGIHVRRGDLMTENAKYYNFGYFNRAVSFIKQNINNPVFFVFCNTDSVEWVRSNQKIFNLNENIDKIYFVSENKNEKSFRDMQLLSLCKHAIITTSTFGYWGAYLNKNKNKITCSPDIRINTTHSF
jgi:hypothetical protein